MGETLFTSEEEVALFLMVLRLGQKLRMPLKSYIIFVEATS